MRESKKSLVGYHGKKPIPNILYPCIWVEPRNTGYEWGQLGCNSKREIDISFHIVAIVDYGFGQLSGREESDGEMLKLSTNLEKLFRNFPKLSITSCTMAQVVNAEYDVVEFNDTWNSIADLELTVNLLST